MIRAVNLSSLSCLIVLSLFGNACVSDDVQVEEPIAAETAPAEANLDDVAVADGQTNEIADSESDMSLPAEAPSSSGSGSFNLENATVYFDYDDSSVQPSSTSTLESLAEFLKANTGRSIRIEGHCDERGSIEYNLALGQRRADAVKNYLETLGVSSSQLSTISFGEEKLKGSDHSQNRRAEFTE